MAEFLIQAKAHWMDSPIFEPSEEQLPSYNARAQKGDIVLVKPDNWTWGTEECPPNYIVVKVPSMSVETAMQYCGKVYSSDARPIMLKKYRYCVPASYVDTVVAAGGTVTITALGMTSRITDKAV